MWQVLSYGETLPGLDQYAVTKFASALECFVKTLADNTGIKSSEIISKLYAAHLEGKPNYGFDIQVCISESLQIKLCNYWWSVGHIFHDCPFHTFLHRVCLVFIALFSWTNISINIIRDGRVPTTYGFFLSWRSGGTRQILRNRGPKAHCFYSVFNSLILY